VYARRANPIRHRRRRHSRRRNPVSGGIITAGFRLAAAGAVIGIAQPFVRSFAASYVGSSPLASAGITFGTAYGLSWLAKFTSFTRKYEHDILLAGATIAAAQLISAYVTPRLGFGGGTMQGPLARRGMYGRNGMRGIAAVSGTPPLIAPPPLPPAAAANAAGMSGIAARPGNWGY
jgi:hypothetical protein